MSDFYGYNQDNVIAKETVDLYLSLHAEIKRAKNFTGNPEIDALNPEIQAIVKEWDRRLKEEIDNIDK